MADSYVVTGAASYVYRTDGTAKFLLAGAPVPDDATPECIDDLLGKELIALVPDEFEAGGQMSDVPGLPVVRDVPKPATKAAAAKTDA